MALVRLDQLLAKAGLGSRQQVKKLIREGNVAVDGKKIDSPQQKVDPEREEVRCRGKLISAPSFTYVMLHKPDGVVSADRDNLHKTVIDLLRDLPEAEKIHPVGRLDIDTTGLMLLTDDGTLAHQLLSPRSHVEKEYEALVERPVTDEDVRQFAEGMDIGDEKRTLPAVLRSADADDRDGQGAGGERVRVILREGRFHQVKRMFEKTGNHVLTLKRVRMGTLVLDPVLAKGDYRCLTDEEVKALKEEVKALKNERACDGAGQDSDEIIRGADEE